MPYNSFPEPKNEEPDNKQLNSLGKMVRARIIEKHKDTIEYLYTAEAKNIVNPGNLESIRRILSLLPNEILTI